jgi:hypothetical protein
MGSTKLFLLANLCAHPKALLSPSIPPICPLYRNECPQFEHFAGGNEKV